MTLTDHQRAVLDLVAQDQPDKAIARRLKVSLPSVKTTLYRLRQKHGLHSRFGLALCYLESKKATIKVQPKLSSRAVRDVVQLSHELDVCD